MSAWELPALGRDVDVNHQPPGDLGPCEQCDAPHCVAVATVSWPDPTLAAGQDHVVTCWDGLPDACGKARHWAPLGATIAVDMPAWRSADLVQAAGITHRQLDVWVRAGLLQPEPGTGGKGHERMFLADQVDLARRIGALADAGLRPGAAHRLAVTDPGLADGVLAALSAPAGVAA